MKKQWLWLIVGAVVLLSGVWFFWFRHYQDRQKFERIEQVVHELSSRVADEFEAEIKETKRYCSREARKFELEPLNCHVANSFDEQLVDRDVVVDFIKKQADIVEDEAGTYRFRLITEDVNCYVYGHDARGNTEIECSKRATGSHYEFVE